MPPYPTVAHKLLIKLPQAETNHLDVVALLLVSFWRPQNKQICVCSALLVSSEDRHIKEIATNKVNWKWQKLKPEQRLLQCEDFEAFDESLVLRGCLLPNLLHFSNHGQQSNILSPQYIAKKLPKMC